jgi:hypothetical protein
LVALFLTTCAWAGQSLVDALDPLDTGNPLLYQSTVMPADDPTLAPDQRRIISAASRLWYAEPGRGELRPIDIAVSNRLDTERAEDALGVAANTFDFIVTKAGDAVYTLGPHKLRLRLLEQKGESTSARDITGQRPSALVAESDDKTRLDGVMPGVTIRHQILPGMVKEYLEIGSAPDVKDVKFIYYTWVYESDLSPKLEAGQVLWSSGDQAVFRFPAPLAWDANEKGLPCHYELGEGQVSIVLDAEILSAASYPVTIDPTVTTDQGDAVYNMRLGEADAGSGGPQDDLFNYSFAQVALPDLTDAFTSIDSATFIATTADGYESPIASAVYCDITSAWDETANVATLLGLTFNDATDTSVSISTTNGQTNEFDILGAAGANGVAKIYNDDSSPDNCTVKLTSSVASATNDVAEIGLQLGWEQNGDGPGVIFYTRPHETYYWYVEIVYTASSGSHGVGMGATFGP